MCRRLHTTPWKLVLVSFCVLIAACKGKKSSDTIATSPADLQSKVSDLLRDFVPRENNILFDSTTNFGQLETMGFLYKNNSSDPLWSSKESWKPEADSLFAFIETSQLFGLFPEDYHFEKIRDIRDKFFADSLEKSDRKNALLWAKADLLLTDAFIQVIRDVKLGRLPQDSVSLRKDSVLPAAFYLQQYQSLSNKGINAIVASLEPTHRGYHLLKQGIKKFLDSADYRSYTLVPYPAKDPVVFKKALQKRLYEAGFISFVDRPADSVQLAESVKQFQKKKGMAIDGRAGEATVRMLNVNDREKFIRIAISLDKYKLLPEQMPSKYIWVNTSANSLELVDGEKITIKSKVICGKAKTRTPLLNSQISQLITYPQWVPPPSIVSREILPAVKRNPGYLARRGFRLVDSKGNDVDPYGVNWAKYSHSIPYRVVQGSGDANALGIMKFVFDNKYSVYLHDTNQRYLFNNNMRSLSHGCVRVQDWEKLTYYILRNDSLQAESAGQYTRIDSLRSWLRGKQKKTISVRNKIPLYIRYFTCEGENGKIIFYDDVYSEDKLLREKYFSSK